MMQTRILVILFMIILVSAYFEVSVLPTAHALTARTDFSDRHTSATMGDSKVCGDHLCAPREKGAGKSGTANSGVIWFHICGGVRC